MGIAMLSVFRSSVAMRRCAPVMVEWTAIAQKVTTDSGKGELAKLRLEIAEVNKSLGETPAVNIDWDHWRSRIQTPGAVDSFKAAYDGLAVPTLADTFTAERPVRWCSQICRGACRKLNFQDCRAASRIGCS